MCDTPIARVTGRASSLRIQVGDSPLELQCGLYQGQQGDDAATYDTKEMYVFHLLIAWKLPKTYVADTKFCMVDISFF